MANVKAYETSCPVWTAFINYRVASRKWIRRAEPRKIHLGDLQRYVFSPDYIPQRGPNGEEEIFFSDKKGNDAYLLVEVTLLMISFLDADEFEKVIDDLGKGRYDRDEQEL